MSEELVPLPKKKKTLSTTSTQRQATADEKKQNRERMKVANAAKTKWQGWEPIIAEAALAQQRADRNGETRHSRMLQKKTERPVIERGPFGNSSCPICCFDTNLRITLEKYWLRGRASAWRIHNETGLEVTDVHRHMTSCLGMRLRNLISAQIMKEDGGLLGQVLGLANYNMAAAQKLLDEGDPNAAAKFSANTQKNLELGARIGNLLKDAAPPQAQPVIIIQNGNLMNVPGPDAIGRNHTPHAGLESTLQKAQQKALSGAQVFPSLEMSPSPDASGIVPSGSMAPAEREDDERYDYDAD